MMSMFELQDEKSEQISRIMKYEDMMRLAQQLLEADELSEEEAEMLKALCSMLEAYYGSDEWKRDFEADEAGLIPKDINRGVLSEDGLYNLLEEFRSWSLQLSEQPKPEGSVKLSDFDEKHVRVESIYGDTFSGVADFFDSCFLFDEYGMDEDGIRVDDFIILESQIASIEEIEVHGTAELRTERLILRRFRPDDAPALHQYLGLDPSTYEYSGWNPYATPEMAQAAVERFIASYEDVHSYSWVLDVDDVVVGTIGAYDYENDRIEVGFSIVKGWRGRGLATEALEAVLEYLTENEGISCVTAWCAADNMGSRKVLEKAGMKLVAIEKDALQIGDRMLDKLLFEYRM
ncbi:MAG: GNAT family N-acetyltransferase [Coriobacteriales bacterium]|nr:GNAT family N-acetyltransferase [Coriobacteriales bacterium]